MFICPFHYIILFSVHQFGDGAEEEATIQEEAPEENNIEETTEDEAPEESGEENPAEE